MCGYLRFSDKRPTIASSPASTNQQRHSSTQLNAQWAITVIPPCLGGLVGSGVVLGEAGAIPVKRWPGSRFADGIYLRHLPSSPHQLEANPPQPMMQHPTWIFIPPKTS